MEEQHRRTHERLQASQGGGGGANADGTGGGGSDNTVFSFRFFGEMSLSLMEDAHAIITIDATARNLGVVLSANATACRLLDAAPGLGARLAALLGHTDEAVVLPALRTVGNLASGAERLTQAVVDGGALAGLVPLLLSRRRNFRREAAWAVSNIAAGTHAQISALLATRGLLDAVLETMVSAEWHVRKEAAWVVCNAAAAGTPAHDCKIVAGGAIPPLVSVLASDEERMITVVLDAVGAMLSVEAKLKADGNPAADMCRFAQQFEENGLIQRLEELQAHASHDVYDKAYALLTKYFGEEEAGAEEPPQAADAAAAAAKLQGSSNAFAADAPRTPTPVAAPFSFTGMTFA